VKSKPKGKGNLIKSQLKTIYEQIDKKDRPNIPSKSKLSLVSGDEFFVALDKYYKNDKKTFYEKLIKLKFVSDLTRDPEEKEEEKEEKETKIPPPLEEENENTIYLNAFKGQINSNPDRAGYVLRNVYDKLNNDEIKLLQKKIKKNNRNIKIKKERYRDYISNLKNIGIFNLYNSVFTPDRMVEIYQKTDIVKPLEDEEQDEEFTNIPEQFEYADEENEDTTDVINSDSEDGRGELEAEQEASGKRRGGLKTGEIDKIMLRNKKYIGTYPANFSEFMPNHIHSDKFGFIVNTDESGKPGKHWTSIYVDKNQEGVIEYYDSFGMEPPKKLMKEVNKLVERIKPNTYLKFKVNKIKHQRADNDNCGYHSMKFLQDRFNGIPFKECSGYSDIKNEKRRLKDIKKFTYV
jgi:hypothetical protein